MKRVNRANPQAMQERVNAVTTRGHRPQIAGLLPGASLLAAGLYAGWAAVSLFYPSTENSLINTLPPTHVLTLAGHQQGASAKVNWELAKAHRDRMYEIQLIVAANARKMLRVNAETGIVELEKIRDLVGMHMLPYRFVPETSTRATPDQILAGEILIARYLGQNPEKVLTTTFTAAGTTTMTAKLHPEGQNKRRTRDAAAADNTMHMMIR